jgi:hypothetical protein
VAELPRTSAKPYGGTAPPLGLVPPAGSAGSGDGDDSEKLVYKHEAEPATPHSIYELPSSPTRRGIAEMDGSQGHTRNYDPSPASNVSRWNESSSFVVTPVTAEGYSAGPFATTPGCGGDSPTLPASPFLSSPRRCVLRNPSEFRGGQGGWV